MKTSTQNKTVILSLSQYLAKKQAGTLEADVDYKIKGKATSDVKINGTSIVSDGVANIPYAVADTTYGLVKPSTDHGTRINSSDGGLEVISAINLEIKAKTNAARLVGCDQINNTILYGLGEYDGTAFTDTQKETARTTIGAEAADATILKQVNIVDNTTSTLTTAPLSARQGKVLNDRITNLEAIGRFLSLWNCVTGLPTTNPETLPYTYKTGDYYRINTVDSTTNYMPNGSTYDGTASTTAYGGTETVARGDLWFYDGTSWGLLKDKVGGFVEDVQVNGTSIVSSGVANIVLEEYTAAEIDTLWNNI